METYCLAMTKVYTFGPTFRAENSNTSRHLSEFWMVEPEIAFADLSDNADLAEDLLKYAFRAVLDEREDDMAFFAERIDPDAVSRLEAFVESDFERMTYTEAVAQLEQSGRSWEFPVSWGANLQAEHERYLCEEVAKKPVVQEALGGLIEDGEVVPVKVEGRTERTCYALDSRLQTTFDGPIAPRVHILSPFDGLIIQRPRTEWLFDFEYTIECYVPEAKRKYGYFVLPILYGDRLVARLDAKADRKAERLIVRKIWIEPWFEASEEFLSRLGDALARFARFNRCTSISVERMSPPKGKGVISRQVRAALAAGRGEPT